MLRPLILCILTTTAVYGQNGTLYQVPKVSQAPAAANTSINSQLVNDANKVQGLSWTAPAHWQPQDPGPMRKGSWLIVHDGLKAEVSVLAFPGSVGELSSNVRRWAEQIQMPLSDAMLASYIQAYTIGSQQGHYVRLEQASVPQATLVGILSTAQGTWFFKISGDRLVVLAQESDFKALLASVH